MRKTMIELENIQLKFNKSSFSCAPGRYQYYHYKCDGFDDVGWGCGYRTIQTMCSWLREKAINAASNNPDQEANQVSQVPSILEMQKILADCGDKPASFVGSRDWIGCFEAMIIIDTLYDVPCRLVHCEAGCDLEQKIQVVRQHFKNNGGPIMMGGDMDTASKGIFGITTDEGETSQLLIADPHLATTSNSIDVDYLVANEWVSWQSIDSFDHASFYNFCLPQKF